MPKYPIKVRLEEGDNALMLLSDVVSALRQYGATKEVAKEFRAEATKADYNHLVSTCEEWVEVEWV